MKSSLIFYAVIIPWGSCWWALLRGWLDFSLGTTALIILPPVALASWLWHRPERTR